MLRKCRELSPHMQCASPMRSTPPARVALQALRRYATRSSRFGANVSLDHFLQRGRALALWRQILRGTRRITDDSTRSEMREMARYEFKRNKNVTDITQIRYLISTGKTQWEGMERYIDGL